MMLNKKLRIHCARENRSSFTFQRVSNLLSWDPIQLKKKRKDQPTRVALLQLKFKEVDGSVFFDLHIKLHIIKIPKLVFTADFFYHTKFQGIQ